MRSCLCVTGQKGLAQVTPSKATLQGMSQKLVSAECSQGICKHVRGPEDQLNGNERVANMSQALGGLSTIAEQWLIAVSPSGFTELSTEQYMMCGCHGNR